MLLLEGESITGPFPERKPQHGLKLLLEIWALLTKFLQKPFDILQLKICDLIKFKFLIDVL